MKRVCMVMTLLWLSAGGARTAAAATGAQPTKAVLLVAESDGSQSTVSFGKSGVEGGELQRLIKAPLQELGIVFVSTASLTPMVGERLPGLALGDEAAANLAQQAGATLAVSVGAVGRSEGAIRSTAMVGQVVDMRVRVLDLASGQVLFDKQMRTAGYGLDAALAQSLASSRALSKILPALRASLAARLPAAEAADGRAMSIRIDGAQGWREVGAIFRSLASSPGMESIDVLAIGPDQVRLRIRSAQSVSTLVGSLRRARIPNGSLAVMANGNAIRIELTITSSSQPILNG